MQESEKQFNPVHPENSDIRQAKEIGPEGRLVEETPSVKTGGTNTPESIVEEGSGVKEDRGEVLKWGGDTQKRIGYLEMMWEARNEFSEEIQKLLQKRIFQKKEFTVEENSYFDRERNKWWQERFGYAFEKKPPGKEALSKLKIRKRERMNDLMRSLQNLDEGEAVESFQEKRRIVYYDENAERFYVLEKEDKRYLSVGDILADYAWGITYVPDGNMPHQVFRQLAKHILVNEARRDVEDIYNGELGIENPALLPHHKKSIFTGEKKFTKGREGLIAEQMFRETLYRFSYGGNLGFVVLRANSVEDGLYKYDFKLHSSRRKRGVVVEKESRPQKIGIQFTIGKKSGKEARIIEAKKLYKREIPVDDIVFVRIRTTEFRNAFKKWLDVSKPAGGPEQFLSKDLKIRLLKEATKELIKIKDEEIEKIFDGKEESSFAKATEDKEKLAA